MAKTSKTRYQVNVRLTEEENKKVEKVASEERLNKSDVVRRSINKELAKMSKEKSKVLTDEERKDILIKMGTMMTTISDIKNDNAKLGNNINQIAKGINQGVVSKGQYKTQAYIDYKDTLGDKLEVVSEELNKLWHIIV